MIEEAMQWIAKNSRPEMVHFGDRFYHTAKNYPIEPPSPSTVYMSTLRGFCDFIKRNIDELSMDNLLIQIVDHEKVMLVEAVDEVWRNRQTIAAASMNLYPDGFSFDARMKTEDFIIGLQANFQDHNHRKELLKLVGTMRAEKIRSYHDDGVTQTVATKSGVALIEESDCPNPVTLNPYRTFREVGTQPPSEFVFRVHQREDELPLCALYEADGGEWKLDAMRLISEYIEGQETGVTVIC